MLLKIFFIVAQKYKLQYITFSFKEFYEEYYNLILNKVEKEEIARTTLQEVAKCIFEHNSDSIDLDIIREELNLGVNETLLPELFQYNILEKRNIGGQQNIRFYFSKLRDYIVSFHVKRWDQKSKAEFQRDYECIEISGVHYDVINFYYPFATLDQKKAIDGPIRENAEKYLNLYRQVLNTHFSFFKNNFSPYTSGEIGFLGEYYLSKQMIGFYGFRKLMEAEDEEIKFIPADKLSSQRSNLSYIYGAHKIHLTGSTNGFRSLDVEKAVLLNEIEGQLTEIIEEGRLNEEDSYYLLTEKVFSIAFNYQASYHGISNNKEPKEYLPIALDRIEKTAKLIYGLKYFKDEMVTKKIEKGEIEEKWDGKYKTINYSETDFSNKDLNWINENALKYSENKINIEKPVRYMNLESVNKCLFRAINELKQLGCKAITEIILPERDAINKTGWFWGNYKQKTMINYMVKIYQLFLEEYKRLIEQNFSTLKSKFKLYSMLPIKVLALEDKRESIDEPILMLYVIRNDKTGSDEVILCKEDEISFDHKTFTVKYRSVTYELEFVKWMSCNNIFYPNRTFLEFKTPTEMIGLRNLVYDKIQSEIKDVFNELLEGYNVNRN